MCGLWAAVSSGKKLNMERLTAMAIDTERRGPHAFGFAWVEADGKLRMYKQEGRVSDEPYMLKLAKNAKVVIGHCRWATRGTPDDDRNNHPHECGDGYLVHNGTILRHQDVIRQKRLRVHSDCDSEILCRLYERKRKGWPLQKLAKCIDAVEHKNNEIAVMGLWHQSFVFFRRGKPLHFSETKGGMYFASYGTELPGKPYLMVEDVLFETRWQKSLETWKVAI